MRSARSVMSLPSHLWSRINAFLLAFIVILGLFIPAFSAFAITPPEIRNQNEQQISQDMHGRDLTGYEFVKSDLRGFDFSEANLNGAVFNISQLDEADLHGADLEDIVAFASTFDRADLRDANLTNALLMQSKFTDSLIDGADFSNAVLDILQKNNLCARAKGANSITGVETSESLGCVS